MAGAQSEKLHAACDECRTRKLRCSGEHPTCGRCEREKIQCIYSPQKQMGRPRKRRREDFLPEVVQVEEQSNNSTSTSASTSASDSGFAIQSLESDGVGSMHESTPTGDAFVAFEGLPTNNAFSCAMVSPTYVGSCDQTPSYDSSRFVDPVDPFLWDQTPNLSGLQTERLPSNHLSELPTCSCLSLSYLSLSDLQSLNSFAFPAVVPRLRPALTAAATICHCSRCPMEVFSAIQNTQSLNALIAAIAERFHKVLAGIDAEAIRLEQAGEKKPFRVGDNSPENMHLHTGRLDCPMGYDLKLDPHDWRKLAKQMLRTEVLGGGHNPLPLIKIVEDLESRQERWHADRSIHIEERTRLFGAENMCYSTSENALCMKMAGQIRVMIDKMDWS